VDNQNILIVISFLFSGFSFAQEDSTSQKKEILIQEVKIIGVKFNEIKTPDLQQQTDKVLSEISGVTLIKRGNYAQEPTIRGLNSGQLSSTLDGMHIFGACTDRMDPISSYVEPNNLNSIQLNLGPTEEQSTTQVGGGLNFKLLKAIPNAEKLFSGRIGAGFETNALAIQSLGSLQYSRKKWALSVNGIFRKANNYYAGNREQILFSQYEKYNVGGSFTALLDSFNIIHVDYLQDNGKDIGYPALTMDVSFANAKIISIGHEYKKDSNRIYKMESKVYLNFIDHAMDDTKRPPETVPMHMDMPGTSRTVGFYSGGKLRVSHKQFIQFKITGFQNDLHAEMTMYPPIGKEMFMLTIPDARRSVIGLSVSDKLYFGSNINLSIGGRFEFVKSEITTLLGRQTLTSFYSGNPTKMNLLYNIFSQFEEKLGKKKMLYFGIAKALRNPTLQEMYGFYLYNRVDGHDYLGNPMLNPESSWNGNLGMKYKTSKWNLNGQIYSYFFKDYIAGRVLADYSVMTIGGKGVKEYVNLPSAILYGSEFTLEWKPIPKLLIQSMNSVSYAKDNDGNALPFIPPFKSVNAISYDLKETNIKLESIIGAQQKHVSTEKYGEKFTPSFYVFNIRAARKFKLGKTNLNCSLSIENILDAVYFEHLDVMKINRQGRNIIAHLTYNF
jgi:iron complex outermembrane receptor protein